MASHNNTSNGRQYQGMTRSPSPVYLMYPPDPSGRRPSQHTQLQYTNPAQREAHERFGAPTLSQAGDAYNPPRQSTGNYGFIPYNQASYQASYHTPNQVYPFQTTSNPSSTAGRSEPTVTRAPGDYTSSEGSSGSSQRPRTQAQLTRFWYCCTPGCPSNGPYIESLYESCYHGCGHLKCHGCRREIMSLRDRADRPRSRRENY